MKQGPIKVEAHRREAHERIKTTMNWPEETRWMEMDAHPTIVVLKADENKVFVHVEKTTGFKKKVV